VLDLDSLGRDEPSAGKILGGTVGEVPEEHSVDRNTVPLEEVADDAIRCRIKLRGDDCELLIGIDLGVAPREGVLPARLTWSGS
jgi:hypothetical protein